MRYTPGLLLLFTLASCGGSDDGGSADCSTFTANQVPSDREPLFQYLGCKTYEALPKESAPHSSMAAHGTIVRVFINDALEQSLMQGGTDHPVGAAAVKELFTADNSLRGWAAMVKVEAGSAGGSWYWYETFNTSTGSPVANGKGVGVCTGCHSSGTDFFRTTFPLQ